MLYQLIVLLTAAAAIILGFRHGLARQTPAAIGVAFGIVSARLLAPGLYGILYGALDMVHGSVAEEYTIDTLSTAIIFISVYYIFKTVTLLVGKVLSKGPKSILDNIGGAVFGLFRYLLMLSVAYNTALALWPDCGLMKFAKSDDGNAVEEVMLLSPALLGGQDVVELSHRIQLSEAKKIS